MANGEPQDNYYYDAVDYDTNTGYENMHYTEDGYGGQTTASSEEASHKDGRDDAEHTSVVGDTVIAGVDPETGEHVAFETYDPEIMNKANAEYEKVAEEAVMHGETLDEYLDETTEVSLAEPPTSTVDKDSTALMEFEPTDMDPMAAAGMLEHDQAAAQEDMDMSLAMTAFASFGLLLFVMWWMLRSCKQKAGESD